MRRIPGLDEWIMGINDPHAPFNEPSDEEIYAELEARCPDADSIIKLLELSPYDLEDFALTQFERPWKDVIENIPSVEEQMREYYYDMLVRKLEL